MVEEKDRRLSGDAYAGTLTQAYFGAWDSGCDEAPIRYDISHTFAGYADGECHTFEFMGYSLASEATCSNSAAGSGAMYMGDCDGMPQDSIDFDGDAACTPDFDEGSYGGFGLVSDYSLPSPVYFGFSGRTGGATNNQYDHSLPNHHSQQR